MPSPEDLAGRLVIRGGRVVDPLAGRDAITDIVITDGDVAAVTDHFDGHADVEIDAAGALVTPGLIDFHSHIFCDVSRLGAPPDEAHLRRGVVAAADAGTAGASTFAAFERYIVRESQTRILSFLNVSVLGLIDFRFGELLNPDLLSLDDAVATAEAHPHIVRGIKARLSEEVVGGSSIEILDRSVKVGEACGLPLMIHIGETLEPLDEVIDHLRPGDIVSHCYTGRRHGILGPDGLLEAVKHARARGVIFDSAHGRGNLDFAVVRAALDAGFLPDVISSDTSMRNWHGPVFDLVTTMSKFLALGMELGEVIERTTIAPARLLGIDREGFGTIEVGQPANVTVLRMTDEAHELTDAAGNTVVTPRLEPALTIRAGVVVEPVAWRGSAPG